MVKRKKITYQNVATCPKEQGVTLIYGEYKLFIPRFEKIRQILIRVLIKFSKERRSWKLYSRNLKNFLIII